MGKRAVLYLRVSTSRQAEKDLSIPDQRRQAEEFCKSKNWAVEGEYLEAGASATSDKRPAFQKMISDAGNPEKPFDVVVVHSQSRFFRDAISFGIYERKLEKCDVEIVSITQAFGNDPTGKLVRHIVAAVDELSSAETAKHVSRSMNENARQGFWNGAKPPFGYRTIEAEKRGDKIKKKLAIDPKEAEIVKDIFRLHEHGEGKNGPMGVRSIVDHFNAKGLSHRNGRQFSSSIVHAILTRTTYKGFHYFNKKDSKTGRKKDRSEWIAVDSPVIIKPNVFDRVQSRLKSRRPTVTPPRETNSPTLLTGLAKCSSGSGMTIRTGKGGKYRYYACNKHMNKGGCDCSRKSIPMDQLDNVVVDQLETRLFTPERVEAILSELLDRTRKSQDDSKARTRDLNKQERGINTKLDRLYEALADGTVKQTDSFRRNVSKLEHERDEVIRLKSQLARRSDLPIKTLTKANLKKFAGALSSKLRAEDSTFRKAYIRQFVSEVAVSDSEIRISGPKSALAAAIGSKQISTDNGVPSFDREWWARQDSNLQPDRYERPALTS